MTEYTPKLKLLKKDPITDGNDTFNIKTMMNDNWDKIDDFAQVVEDKLNDVDDLEQTVNDLIEQVGNLEELDTDTKNNLIAAINEIYQKFNSHKADEVSHMTSTDINNLQTVFNSFVGRHIQGRPIANANDATITGFYYLSTGASNKPTSNDGALFVISYSAIWVTQVVLDWRTNKLYSRVCNNGTWTSWEEITTQTGGVVTGVGAGFANKRYTIHIDSDGLYLKEV